ncbi:MAG: hypothetical protein JRJ56_07195, partial [Deltaproteobacteria bacterium]|nr:hypothetical protein [Deltaproteobacteria bacterium]
MTRHHHRFSVGLLVLLLVGWGSLAAAATYFDPDWRGQPYSTVQEWNF